MYLFELLCSLRNLVYSLNQKTKWCYSFIQHVFIISLQDKALALQNLHTLENKIIREKVGNCMRAWYIIQVYHTVLWVQNRSTDPSWIEVGRSYNEVDFKLSPEWSVLVTTTVRKGARSMFQDWGADCGSVHRLRSKAGQYSCFWECAGRLILLKLSEWQEKWVEK